MYFEYMSEKQEVTRTPWSRTACWGPSLGAGSVVGGEGRKWRSGAEGVREWQGRRGRSSRGSASCERGHAPCSSGSHGFRVAA